MFIMEYFGSVKKIESSRSILCKEYIHPDFLKSRAASGLLWLKYQNGDDILQDFIQGSKKL